MPAVSFFGLPLLDLVVIVVYFAAIIAIGAWCARRIRGEEDYFLAGRRFGKLVQTFAAFGQGTSADNAVGVSTLTMKNGAAGIWGSLLYLFATPIFWFTSPWMRRLRLLTTGDFFVERYGSKPMAAVYAVIGAIGMMAFIALGFSAMTKTIVAMTPKSVAEFSAEDEATYQQEVAKLRAANEGKPDALGVLTLEELRERQRLATAPPGSLSQADQTRLTALNAKAPATIIAHLDANVLVWIVCFVVLLYAVAGGLEAAFLTDMIQGVFIILLSILLIPFAWDKINDLYGGRGPMDAMQTIHRLVPDEQFRIFGSPNAVDFTWYYIIALSIMTTFNVVVQPNMLVATGSARTEYAARYGFTVGNFLKRFCTILWGVFGLAAIVLYATKVHHPDLTWGYASRDLLGPLNLGLVGLMIACLMAALMSTVDCYMLTCSSLLTHNLYRPVVTLVAAPGHRHFVWAGRFFGALVVIGGALIALQFATILQILKFIWEINVMVVPAFWLGIKWRRATRWGAWVSMLFGALAFLILPLLLPALWPTLHTHQALLATPRPPVVAATATEQDVARRQAAIAQWQARDAMQKSTGPRPQPLQLGQEFAKPVDIGERSIFWTQGVKPGDDGQLRGHGMLNVELVLLDQLGFDLRGNVHALNETIRIAIRTSVPILIMLVVSLVTPADDPERVRRFFARMRCRVNGDPDEDARELAHSMQDPERHEQMLLFPRSNWEFYKWTREDFGGFALACVGVVVVLAVMSLLVSLGG